MENSTSCYQRKPNWVLDSIEQLVIICLMAVTAMATSMTMAATTTAATAKKKTDSKENGNFIRIVYRRSYEQSHLYTLQ